MIHIRLSKDQYDAVEKLRQRTACRSLTEYARMVLIREPVIVKVRDQTREDILHRLGVIKSLVEDISDAAAETQVLDVLNEIRDCIRQIAQTCSR